MAELLKASRALFFGGSFNPIHLGHVACSRSAAKQRGFDRVVLVPAWRSPFKTDSTDSVGGVDRLRMCELAVAGEPDFSLLDLELNQARPSYTIDTAHSLRRMGLVDNRKVAWLVGTDHLPRLHQWHQFDQLLDVVEFVVMRRSGETVDPSTLDPRVRPIAGDLVEVPSMPMSSSAIRDRVRQGVSIDDWVHPDVAKYIADRKLYV